MTDPGATEFKLSDSITVHPFLYLDLLALLDANCFADETYSAAEESNEAADP